MVLTNTDSLMEDVICSRAVQRELTALPNLGEGKFHICNIFSLRFLKKNNFAATPKPKKKGERKDVSVRISAGNLPISTAEPALGTRGLLF